MMFEDKITEIFCMEDDFYKFFDAIMVKYTIEPAKKGKYHHSLTMSKGEIMIIIILFLSSQLLLSI